MRATLCSPLMAFHGPFFLIWRLRLPWDLHVNVSECFLMIPSPKLWRALRAAGVIHVHVYLRLYRSNLSKFRLQSVHPSSSCRSISGITWIAWYTPRP